MRREWGAGLGRLLGLERLEGAKRAPQLGERAAAIAQERVERARSVAIPDQGEAEAATAAVPVSNARAEASRRNGARSRGPKTLEGKVRSAQNALKP